MNSLSFWFMSHFSQFHYGLESSLWVCMWTTITSMARLFASNQTIARMFRVQHPIPFCSQFHPATAGNLQQPLTSRPGNTHFSLATGGLTAVYPCITEASSNHLFKKLTQEENWSVHLHPILVCFTQQQRTIIKNKPKLSVCTFTADIVCQGFSNLATCCKLCCRLIAATPAECRVHIIHIVFQCFCY